MAKPTQPQQPKKKAKKTPLRHLPEDTPLTPQQQLFVEEYTKDWMSGKAALRAGYKSACMGSQLLQKNHICHAISLITTRITRRNEVTRERIIDELASIAFVNGAKISRIIHRPIKDQDGNEISKVTDIEFTPTDNLEESDQRAIAGMSVSEKGIKVSQHDKTKALALLMQHFGMLEKGKEATPPEEHAKQIRDALDGIDEAVTGE